MDKALKAILGLLLLPVSCIAQTMQMAVITSASASSSIVRGTSQYSSGASNVSSAVIPIPSGSVAGDFAIIFAGAAYNITAVSGWTTIQLNNGHAWNLYAAKKALSSGDISTGTVTVTTGGSFDTVGGMITFIGATSGVREFQVAASIQSSTNTLTTTSAVTSSDVGVYWWSSRGAPAVSITPGAGAVTGAYTQTITTTASGTHSLLEVQKMPGGAQTNSYGVAGSAGAWPIQVVVSP